MTQDQLSDTTTDVPPVEEMPIEDLLGTEPVMDDSLPEDRFLNRELSWLDFNARVLTLAEDPDTRLLERASSWPSSPATWTSSTWCGSPG